MCRMNRFLLLAGALLPHSWLSGGEAPGGSEGAQELLKNGTFEEADGGLPRGWELSVGAVSGNTTKANEVTIETEAESRVVRLRGTEETDIWNSPSQSV